MNQQGFVDAIVEAISAHYSELGLDSVDAIEVVNALISRLDLDQESVFKIGQSLVTDAFYNSYANTASKHSRHLAQIVSEEAANEELSLSDDTPQHREIAEPRETNQNTRSEVALQIRNSLRGIQERNECLGGYTVLADMTQHKNRQTNTRRIYNPSALGLRHARHPTSLYELVLHERIKLDKVTAHSFNTPDSLRLTILNPGRPIFVLLDRGTVFERKTEDEIQNLCVKDSVRLRLETGRNEVQIGALCMDSGRAAPDGETMLLTPWIVNVEIDDQQTLWEFTGPSEEKSFDQEEDDYEDYKDSHDSNWKCTYHICGEVRGANSQKSAFCEIIQELSKSNVDLLSELANRYQKAKVPLLVRRRNQLPNWAQKSAMKLNGYWLHTGMSANQKLSRLRTVCEIVGIQFGNESGLKVDFSL